LPKTEPNRPTMALAAELYIALPATARPRRCGQSSVACPMVPQAAHDLVRENGGELAPAATARLRV
jgi:hypothetical protein